LSDTTGAARTHDNPVIDEESPAPAQQPDGGEIVEAREKSPESDEMSAEELEAERQRRLVPENRPEATRWTTPDGRSTRSAAPSRTTTATR
jgi:hypothetical protein